MDEPRALRRSDNHEAHEPRTPRCNDNNGVRDTLHPIVTATMWQTTLVCLVVVTATGTPSVAQFVAMTSGDWVARLRGADFPLMLYLKQPIRDDA